MSSSPRVLVLDGSFAAQYIKVSGKDLDGDPLWTARSIATNPEYVKQVHLDFLKAGSDIIETITYQASVEGFMKHLKITEEESLQLIKKAVDIAKDAVNEYNQQNPRQILIAGSIGPYGAILNDGSEYTGSYGENILPETLRKWHIPRLEVIVNSGVDLLAIETIPCRKEAQVLVELLKNYPNMKAWLSFSCKDGTSLSNGENFQEVAKFCYDLNPGQLLGVGVNCVSPKFVDSLFKDFNAKNKIPLVVYSNSGEKYEKECGWTGKSECKPLPDYVKGWLDNGVRYVGGCCRTEDQDIKGIKEEVENWRNNLK